mmetsp:Transcript_5815/g.11657  ORF Transcript_5815/g.11657 Transcript_5815/m.11657 type:complete len:235 (+) Transcript_5815:890-1594(+)
MHMSLPDPRTCGRRPTVCVSHNSQCIPRMCTCCHKPHLLSRIPSCDECNTSSFWFCSNLFGNYQAQPGNRRDHHALQSMLGQTPCNTSSSCSRSTLLSNCPTLLHNHNVERVDILGDNFHNTKPFWKFPMSLATGHIQPYNHTHHPQLAPLVSQPRETLWPALHSIRLTSRIPQWRKQGLRAPAVPSNIFEGDYWDDMLPPLFQSFRSPRPRSCTSAPCCMSLAARQHISNPPC